MSTNALEQALAMAGGWDAINKMLDPAVKERVELASAKTEEDRKAIARAWADFAASPDGAKALDVLFASTLNRIVYFTQLGMSAEQTGIYGAFREGQMSVADEIRRLIIQGNGDAPPPKRGI